VLEVVRAFAVARREGSVRCGHDDRDDETEEGGLETRTNRDDGGSSSSNSLSEKCLREVAKMNFQASTRFKRRSHVDQCRFE